MAYRPATVTVDARRLSAGLRRSLAGLSGARLDAAARGLTLAAVGRVARYIGGAAVGGVDMPKRIDTGRYRAGWGMAASSVGIPAAVPRAGTSEAGDGSGARETAPYRVVYSLTNAVEYGPFLEYGTERMAAGLHLQTAIIETRKSAPKLLRTLLADAVEGR